MLGYHLRNFNFVGSLQLGRYTLENGNFIIVVWKTGYVKKKILRLKYLAKNLVKVFLPPLKKKTMYYNFFISYHLSCTCVLYSFWTVF